MTPLGWMVNVAVLPDCGGLYCGVAHAVSVSRAIATSERVILVSLAKLFGTGLTPELSRTAARNGGVVHVTMQPSREAVSA